MSRDEYDTLNYITLTVTGINPHPWRVAGTGRGKTTGFKSGALEAYQLALNEDVYMQLNDPETPLKYKMPEPPYEVEFWFWRQLEEGIRGEGRKTRGHQSDATNLQKATEDALQGVLFGNDRDVRKITSEIRSQSPDTDPKIIIVVKHYVPQLIMTGYANGDRFYPAEGKPDPYES